MDEIRWWYEIDGVRNGPCSLEKLQALIADGNLGLASLVWHKGLRDWVRADAVAELAEALAPNEPPPLPKELAAEMRTTKLRDEAVSLWARFWARIIDAALFGVVVTVPLSLLIGYTFPSFSLRFLRGAQSGASIIIAIWVTPLWLALDALILSRWGTTPGKWIAGIIVRDHEGNLPSLKTSFARSFHIWWRAYGLSLPLVNMATLAIAYGQSKRAGGVAPWDKKLGLEVRAAIPRGRTATAGVIAIVATTLVMMLGVATQSITKRVVNAKTMPWEMDWSSTKPKPEAAKAPRMEYDVEGARKARLSDADIAAYLAKQLGFDIDGARNAGYSDSDIIAHLVSGESLSTRTPKEAKSDFGEEFDRQQAATRNAPSTSTLSRTEILQRYADCLNAGRSEQICSALLSNY